MRDVIVDSAPSEHGEGLGPLLPRFQNRLSLQGGLSLPRGTNVYLTGGEPDLWLPDANNVSHLDVAVDGAAQAVTGPMLRICSLNLTEGPHDVRVGPITRSFSTQRTAGHMAPVVNKQVGHAVLRDELETLARTLDATAVDDISEGTLVIGATIIEYGEETVDTDRPSGGDG